MNAKKQRRYQVIQQQVNRLKRGLTALYQLSKKITLNCQMILYFMKGDKAMTANIDEIWNRIVAHEGKTLFNPSFRLSVSLGFHLVRMKCVPLQLRSTAYAPHRFLSG